MKKTLQTTLALSLLFALAAPAAAQQQAKPPKTPASWSLGLRLGAFDMINSADSYDAVYGDPVFMGGAVTEVQWRRLRFALSLDYGSVGGERVLLTGGSPRGTGVDQDLTLLPVHLTAFWRFNPGSPWEWSAGLGPSLLMWEDEGPGVSNDGTDTGGSVALALRRTAGGLNAPGWEWGGELRWSTFPGALPNEGGVTAFYDEDDPGGIALTFSAIRRF
ncbi:MAG TPA: hypothetical protein VKU40_04005 [Thermoanaerobaculia bacterium]|nr:hypothetical protein [Thermoanaerobaculia bacterium]